ncbi:MAG: MFS transporter [Eggerthellaceae bacterium]|nr:MFS transporter [Eggerthellaceae bacterium]
MEKNRTGAILAIYLLGLLLGGLYVGMVAPVRTVIQEYFAIDSATGIWMINIYSLFYAALIPVIGKIADLRGRKRVFIVCVLVFCLGAAMCGLSARFGGFALLLAGRVVQAVGACGMIPVANAELGTSMPPEKRGMALGIAAAVMGVSNVLGSAVGSAVLGVFGSANWSMLFFVSLPAGVLLCVAAAMLLPNNKVASRGKLDYAGSVAFVAAVLVLLFALRRVDFLDLGASVADPYVLGAFAVAAVLVVAFVLIERRAADPVFHLEYLRVRPIVITMVVSFFIGCITISMTLVPEFAEVALGKAAGSGGYYVLAIGVTSIFATPIGGKLIDKRGAKPVLLFGLATAAVGYLFLAFVAAPHPSNALMIVGLMIVGLGMGFSMGAPTNYMILENTDPSESASAIATITFVRQIGVTLAPAIFVGFIADGAGVGGYAVMLACIAAFALAGALLMLAYRPR